MKKGDRVRHVPVRGQRYGYVKPDQIYTIRFVDSTSDCIFLEGVIGNYAYPKDHFVLVDEILVQLRGEVINRAEGTVSFKLADGDETVLLPARLLPEDPKLTKFREMVAKYEEKAQPYANAAALVRAGSRDHVLREIVNAKT